MISLWLPFTFAAALLQTWRTAMQQRLRGRFSVATASLVRYLYGVPVAVATLAAYCLAADTLPPTPTPGFLLGCLVGGIAQILGTALLIMAFGHRNFAVGTAYSKTDGVQAALIAWAVFGLTLPSAAWIGIAVGVAGVLVLSLAGRGVHAAGLLRATFQPAALCGLGAGTGFAVTGLGIKSAVAALGTDDALLGALFALFVVNVMQLLLQGGWMAWRDPQSLRAAFTAWREAIWIGVLSTLGSACWFIGFALAPVSLVRTVGQVEMIFTLSFSRFYLGETLRAADVAGLCLIVAGVVLVLAFH